MKREKRFLENDNTFIYVGTAIFVLLAVAIGIIMYMTTSSGVRIEGNVSKEQELTENVTSDIGKTIEQSQETANASKENKNEEVQASEQNVETSEVIPNVITQTEAPVKNETKVEENSTPVEKENTAKNIENKKEITFMKPAEGEIIGEYAKDNLIYSETLKEWITHTAIDIKVDKTSVIKSAAEGVIKSIINDPRYGLTVVISHNEGYETVYSNLLTAEFVVVGEEVAQGQTIGTAGNTAAFESNMECHLHFELLKDGEYLNPAIYF